MRLFLCALVLLVVSQASGVRSQRLALRSRQVREEGGRLLGTLTKQVGNSTVSMNFGTPGLPSLQEAISAFTSIFNNLFLNFRPLSGGLFSPLFRLFNPLAVLQNPGNLPVVNPILGRSAKEFEGAVRDFASVMLRAVERYGAMQRKLKL